MTIDPWTFSTWILPVLLAITFHEAAHGFAARALGDPTAEAMGRISLNPLRHVDPFGTILLPGLLLVVGAGFLFGYARPVPVDLRYFHNPRRDMMLVSAAGPAMNLGLALASAILYHGLVLVPDPAGEWIAYNLMNSIKFNILLAVFNMIPIPPLDGGRVAVGLLPGVLARLLARVEPFGVLVLLGLFLVLPRFLDGFDPAALLLEAPVRALTRLVLTLSGLA
ncbi:MAG: site-2 protease family protein [Alphaproteobacteria bacterium]